MKRSKYSKEGHPTNSNKTLSFPREIETGRRIFSYLKSRNIAFFIRRISAQSDFLIEIAMKRPHRYIIESEKFTKEKNSGKNDLEGIANL